MSTAGKNILIFADGTGQAGGFRPDQLLSNIYKLYRATRSGPDSPIDPSLQVAFYDPGLGTATAAGIVKLRLIDFIRVMAGSVAGIGISTNVTDCYQAIIKHYQPGDRIYLFGFSRGAYTARSVAGVLNLCGVPTQDGKGGPLPRAGKALRAIAAEAVSGVYDHGAGKPRADYRDQRLEKARRFRKKYASGDEHAADVHPYFIGLFDAVAALGMPRVLRYLSSIAFVAVAALALWGSLELAGRSSDWNWGWTAFLGLSVLLLYSGLSYLASTFKYIGNFPQDNWYRRFHLARWQGKNYDPYLDPRVNVVRHALSVDESRQSFDRVVWGQSGEEPVGAPGELERFQQYWFAGNHSDIGGSYAEDESRLSDISLTWILGEATGALHPILVDYSKLNLYPSVDGVQHCQVESFRDSYPRWWNQSWRPSWPAAFRKIKPTATLHPSILRRFELAGVSQCGVLKPYRPEALREHQDLAHFYR